MWTTEGNTLSVFQGRQFEKYQSSRVGHSDHAWNSFDLWCSQTTCSTNHFVSRITKSLWCIHTLPWINLCVMFRCELKRWWMLKSWEGALFERLVSTQENASNHWYNNVVLNAIYVLNIEPWELENRFPYSFIGPVADSRCLSGRGEKNKHNKANTFMWGRQSWYDI